MLQPKKGFENIEVSYRLGLTHVNISTHNITQAHIDIAKRYNVDLEMYVEEVENPIKFNTEELEELSNKFAKQVEVPEELLEIQEPIKPKANGKRKKAPNKNISKS